MKAFLRERDRKTAQIVDNYGGSKILFLVRKGPLGTLVIRIATITLASDSAIVLARFRPSKFP